MNRELNPWKFIPVKNIHPERRENFEEAIPILKRFITSLLGEKIERLNSQYLLGLSSNQQSKYHRLINLGHRLAQSENQIKNGAPIFDYIAFAETKFLFQLFDKWRDQEEWKEIQTEIYNPLAYVHCLVLLYWLSCDFFKNCKTSIIPRDKISGVRTADAMVKSSSNDILLVELKTPEKLINNQNLLTNEEAYKIIKKARNKIGSGKKKQTGHNNYMLLIGGLFITIKNMEVLEKAAEESFKRVPSKSLTSIQIFTFKLSFESNVFETNSGVIIDPTFLQKTIINTSKNTVAIKKDPNEMTSDNTREVSLDNENLILKDKVLGFDYTNM